MQRTEAELLSEFLCEENQHELVAMARALCPFAEAVTDDVILVCVALVEAKGDAGLVAEATGFSRWQVRRRSQSQVAQQIIKKLTKEKMRGEGYLKAVSAMMDIAGSSSVSPAARIKASESLIKMADADDVSRGGEGSNGPDLNAMSLKQLEAYCAAIKQDLIPLPSNNALQGVDTKGG